MTGRIEKTVFISYRRTNFPWAYCIYQDLTHHGYDVFFDYQSINSGDFEKAILDNIRARAHFIVILSSSALERFNQPGDWLKREIETAINEKRNIIPILLEGFDFGSPLAKQSLVGKLASLSNYNGMSLVSEYVEAGFDKLRNRFLSVALEDVHLFTLTKDAEEITKNQIAAANEAAPVEKEQLTAQEWFERGYSASNVEESIRYLTEAIRLDPKLAAAYTGRGLAYRVLGEKDKALLDFEIALGIDREDEFALVGRGTTRYEKNNLDGAIEDFNQAIKIRPRLMAYIRRGRAFDAKGDTDEAIADFTTAVNIGPTLPLGYYPRAVILEKTGELKGALADYQKYLELGGAEQDDNKKKINQKIKSLKIRLTKKK
jgi:tetratricopeptide (TPR) repeat protein